LLIKTAKVLGKSEDVNTYSTLLKNIKDAFMKEYMTPSGRLVSSTQTAYVLALNFDMLPEHLRPQAAERLAENVKSYGNHLTTGFLGTPYLCHVLTRFGYLDVAYDLLLQETYPSWLYPVKMGATTIWERWDGIRPDSSFQTPTMNSFNHWVPSSNS
jgi:Bacterial alpha-L-rhamnosidase.